MLCIWPFSFALSGVLRIHQLLGRSGSGNIAGKLAEMVFHVADVVGENKCEGEAFAVVQPDVVEAGEVGVLGCVGEVAVEGETEGENLRPRFEVEALEADAIVLLVAGEGEFRRELHADEPLEIVAAGVNEVADGLLRRPLAWGKRLCGGFGGEGGELAFGAGEDAAEVSREGTESCSCGIESGVGHIEFGVSLRFYFGVK